MTARMEKVRRAIEAAHYPREADPYEAVKRPALAEVEEWEAQRDDAFYMAKYLAQKERAEAAEAEADRLKAALDDIEARPEDTLRVQAVARAALAPADRNTT